MESARGSSPMPIRHMAYIVTNQQQITDSVEVKEEPELDEAPCYYNNKALNPDTNDPLLLEPKPEPLDLSPSPSPTPEDTTDDDKQQEVKENLKLVSATSSSSRKYYVKLPVNLLNTYSTQAVEGVKNKFKSLLLPKLTPAKSIEKFRYQVKDKHLDSESSPQKPPETSKPKAADHFKNPPHYQKISLLKNNSTNSGQKPVVTDNVTSSMGKASAYVPINPFPDSNRLNVFNGRRYLGTQPVKPPTVSNCRILFGTKPPPEPVDKSLLKRNETKQSTLNLTKVKCLPKSIQNVLQSRLSRPTDQSKFVGQNISVSTNSDDSMQSESASQTMMDTTKRVTTQSVTRTTSTTSFDASTANSLSRSLLKPRSEVLVDNKTTPSVTLDQSLELTTAAELDNNQPKQSTDAPTSPVTDLISDHDDFGDFFQPLSPLPPPDTTDYTPQEPYLDETSGLFNHSTDSADISVNAQKTPEIRSTIKKPRQHNMSLNDLFSQSLNSPKPVDGKNIKMFTTEDLVREFKKVQEIHKSVNAPSKRKKNKPKKEMFEALAADMNPTAKKIFWNQINSGCRNNLSGNRFSHEEKVLFASILAISQPCYSILQKILVLPCPRTLKLFNKSLIDKGRTELHQPVVADLDEGTNHPEEFITQSYEANEGSSEYLLEFRQDTPLSSALNDICSPNRPSKRLNVVVSQKAGGKTGIRRKRKKVDETALAVASINVAPESEDTSYVAAFQTVNDQPTDDQAYDSNTHVYSTTARMDAIQMDRKIQLLNNPLTDASNIWISQAAPQEQSPHYVSPKKYLLTTKSTKVNKGQKSQYRNGFDEEFGNYMKRNVTHTIEAPAINKIKHRKMKKL